MGRWTRRWLSRKQDDDDLSEELRAHLAIEVQQRMEAGESFDEAAPAARRAFGNIARTQEDIREQWGWAGVERFAEDVGFGLRMLRKTPVWTVVISAMLALGVGLSTAIFSVVYGVLLQPLPYPNADRLVALWPTSTRNIYSPRFMAVNAALWLEWRKNSTLLEDIALTRPIANFNLTGEGAAERLQGARTSFNVPLVLRVSPLLGRVFTEEEQHADARVAILSHAFWQRRFGGDPGILGRKIQLNGEPFEVVGVMPPEYRYPSGDFELWTPLYIPPGEIRHGMNYQYRSIGRLKAGVSLEQAQAEFTSAVAAAAGEHAAHRVHPAAHSRSGVCGGRIFGGGVAGEPAARANRRAQPSRRNVAAKFPIGGRRRASAKSAGGGTDRRDPDSVVRRLALRTQFCGTGPGESGIFQPGSLDDAHGGNPGEVSRG